MNNNVISHPIRVAIAGLGNCASSLIEGIYYYRQHPETDDGLLFASLAGYSVRDIEVVVAFDISTSKVGRPLREAIHQSPNNFVPIRDVQIDNLGMVYRGPTLDGNPPHLAQLVIESEMDPVDVVSVLTEHDVDVLLNLLPTGSIRATEFYANAALQAGCAFINCIPTVIAQRSDFQDMFRRRRVPLLGDDIKSQVGTTILHRALLSMLESRGAVLKMTSQVNLGGNTDFANFVHRAETKLVSKRKSLARYLNHAVFHVGHHFDPTKGPFKHAFIEIDSTVFGGSHVRISVKLESDDKPNSAGSVVDLVRIAKAARERQIGGYIPEACAFYMKSPPDEMDDFQSLHLIRQNWSGISTMENEQTYGSMGSVQSEIALTRHS
ncbi:MAG: inositol-3-phosphate synthase [Thaumarchaeota archaeon]|nr:inositol-3-phosphate synthase [Nitrososphaerota archaeon]